MTEQRYERVSAVHEDLYVNGAPVMISAAVLLRDRYTGTLLAQMKFQSMADETITALKVKIQPLDAQEEFLGDAVENTYDQLSVERDEMFGQQYVTALPDHTTSDIRVWITEVIFEEGEPWVMTDDAVWEPLAEPAPITELIPEELLGLFREQFGESTYVQMLHTRDLWYCTCGTLSREGEKFCRRCGVPLETLETRNITLWVEEQRQRLAEEEAAREAERLAEEERQAKKKRLKKIIIWSSTAAAVTAILVCAGVFWKYLAYGVGDLLLTMDQYDASKAVFTMLSEKEFRDADDRVWEAQTEYAKSRLKVYDYEEAVECLGENQSYRLMQEPVIASLFLTGEWYDEKGKYYFAMEDNGGVRYNLVVPIEANGTYSIKESYFVREDEEGNPIILWQFLVVDEDTIEIAVQNGKVYTLHRYG